jgi:hypothetical protein
MFRDRLVNPSETDTCLSSNHLLLLSAYEFAFLDHHRGQTVIDCLVQHDYGSQLGFSAPSE